MSEERPDSGEDFRASEEADGDNPAESRPLSGNLESLLQEEGLGDLEVDELFAEDETASLESGRDGGLSSGGTRSERRQRDQREFRNLEGAMISGLADLQISEDRLVARVNRIDASTNHETIDRLLEQHGVVHGVDFDSIQDALMKAGRGTMLGGVVVARGTPPRVIRKNRIQYRSGLERQSRSFARLQELLLESPSADGFHGWSEPMSLVSQGDVLAEVVPAEVAPGRDVCGRPISLEAEEAQVLWAGENTSLSADGTRCVADIFGYAGLIDGEPVVVPPLWVAPDRMEVRFVNLPVAMAASRPPGADEIRRLLQVRWIEHGVMEEEIVRLCDRLQRGMVLPPTLPVAQGDRPVPGENAQILYAFDPDALLNWAQFNSLLEAPSPEVLSASLNELIEGMGGQPLCMVVRTGQVIAEKLPATEGVVGRDVEGEEIVPEGGEELPLEAGERVRLTEDGGRCVAELFGYVCQRFDQINVVPPLWIAPDRSAAYFLNLPQQPPSTYPDFDEMNGLLEHFGIKHGFRAEEWEATAAALESGQQRERLIPIATATRAQPGRDATFDWAIEIEQNKVGKVLEDGSIDFRERNLTTVVREGDLIGKLLSVQDGTSGVDVLGNEIQPARPLSIEVLTDPRVYTKEVDGELGFYAETGGGVTHEVELKRSKQRTRRRIRLGISPISNIDGDVDYSTGNIDFHGDVVVRGSVQSLFSVKATGDVSIGGYVEAGAFIATGKDIAVKGGVVGANTELVAGGSVLAKFIQEATVRAEGDVQAGAYLFNASIRAGGRVVVLGKGEGKSRALVGGLIWAGRGIEAASIGSPYSSSTRLVAGVDPDRVNRMEQLRANIAACDERQKRLMDKIGLDSLDVELVRQKLRRTSAPQHKKLLASGLKRIASISALQESLRQEVSELAAEQRRLARQAEIIVRNRLFAGVEVRLGEEALQVQDDHDRVRLHLLEEDGRLRIEVGMLHR